MKIALVLEDFDPQRGGAEGWTWQFARQLLARQMGVTIVARRAAESAYLPGLEFQEVRAGGSRCALAAAAEQVLRRLRVDIVHDMGVGWCCDVLQPHGGARPAAFEANLRMLPAWQRPLKRAAARWLPRYRDFAALAERQFAPGGPLVLALSRRVAQDITRWHQVPATRQRVVYNGVDLERFRPAEHGQQRRELRRRWELAEDLPLLLIVAHNFALKGVGTLLEALANLKRRGTTYQLAVVGGGPAAPYQRLARRLGVAEWVRFPGPQADPAACYAAADVYVQPTFYDPCSLVVLEALAMGLPVVTSSANGVSELLEGTTAGEVVRNPADAVELADAILALGGADQWHTRGRAARALAEQHSLTRNCEEVLAAYGSLESGRRRAA